MDCAPGGGGRGPLRRLGYRRRAQDRDPRRRGPAPQRAVSSTEFYRGIVADEAAARPPPITGCRELASRSPRPSSPIRSPRTIDRIATPRPPATTTRSTSIRDFAKAAGLPGIIVHGLCLMAFAGRAVLASREIESPAAVRRLGDPVLAAVHRVTGSPPGLERDGGRPFDAPNGLGAVVLKDGLAELGAAQAVVIDLRRGHGDRCPPPRRGLHATDTTRSRRSSARPRRVLPRRRRDPDDRRRRHLLPRTAGWRRRLHGRLGVQSGRPPVSNEEVAGGGADTPTS